MAIDLMKYWTDTIMCPHCRSMQLQFVVANGPMKTPTVKQKGGTLFQVYKLMECQNCKGITLSVVTSCHPGPMIGDPYPVRIDYFPPLPSRVKPQWLSLLNTQMSKLIDEIYAAIDSSLYSIASTGIRTVLDKLMIDTVGDIGTYQVKLGAMLQKGAIDANERALLEAVIDAGSASAHRAYKPSRTVLRDMLDILESLLEKSYVVPKRKVTLQKKAVAIKKRIPPRRTGKAP